MKFDEPTVAYYRAKAESNIARAQLEIDRARFRAESDACLTKAAAEIAAAAVWGIDAEVLAASMKAYRDSQAAVAEAQLEGYERAIDRHAQEMKMTTWYYELFENPPQAGYYNVLESVGMHSRQLLERTAHWDGEKWHPSRPENSVLMWSRPVEPGAADDCDDGDEPPRTVDDLREALKKRRDEKWREEEIAAEMECCVEKGELWEVLRMLGLYKSKADEVLVRDVLGLPVPSEFPVDEQAKEQTFWLGTGDGAWTTVQRGSVPVPAGSTIEHVATHEGGHVFVTISRE